MNAKWVEDLDSKIKGISLRAGTGKMRSIPAGTYPGVVSKISLGRCGMSAKIPGALRIKLEMYLLFGEKRGEKVTAYYTEPNMTLVLDKLSQGFGNTIEEKIEAANRLRAIWQVYYNPNIYLSIQIGGRVDGDL